MLQTEKTEHVDKSKRGGDDRSEKRLHEERFRTVMEQSPLSMQIFNASGETVRVNAAWERLWGESRKEVEGYNILEDEQLKAAGLMEHIKKAFSGETVKLPETYYDPAEIGKPGRGRWIEGYIYPLITKNEKAFDVVLVHNDITDNKEAERKLAESEQHLRTALEAGEIGSWEWDIETNSVNWSDNLEKQHGLEPGGFDGKFETFLDAIHPDDRAELLNAINRAVHDDEPYQIEHRWVKQNGDVIWLEGKGRVVRNEDGQARRMTGTCMNITERKRIELLQTEQNKLLELIASDAALEECLTALCNTIPKLSFGLRAAVLPVDISQNTFNRPVAPDLNNSFINGLEGADIYNPGLGTCGTAVCSGIATQSMDIKKEEKWSKEILNLFLENNIKAIHSTPVFDKNKNVIASFPLLFDEPRTPDKWEYRLADFGAHTTSIAIEQKRTRQALRKDEKKAAFRAALTDALRPLEDAESIKEKAARILGEYLEVNRAFYAEMEDDGEHIYFKNDFLMDAESVAGRYHVENASPTLKNKLTAGLTLAITDVTDPDDELQLQPSEVDSYTINNVRGYAAVPLIKNNKLIAYMGFHQTVPRKWTDEEIDLMEETAERTWSAIKRARAEQKTKKSEHKYRTLFESMGEGYGIVHVLFDENNEPVNYEVVDINPAAKKMLGIGEIKGKTPNDVIPDYEGFSFKRYGKVAQTREPVHFEKYFKPFDRYYSVSAYPYGQPEEQKAAIHFNDITKQKQQEEELISLNENLEERVERRTESLITYQKQLRSLAFQLSRAKEQERNRLAAELHDNLGQMLAVIKMRMDFIQKEQDLDAISGATQLVEESIKYTRKLMSDLKPPPSMKGENLSNALKWVTRAMNQYEIDITLKNYSQTEPEVREDIQTTLIQAVRELLFNVIKYADTDEAKITLAFPRNFVKITVEDHGKGFDSKNTESTEMGGFGLFHIKEQMDVLGGRALIDSKPGKGTRITLMVPLDDEGERHLAGGQTAGRAEEHEAAESVSKIKVLLVDDHDMMREGLRKIIDSEDDLTVVAEAADAETAINTINQAEPDVVIMDINLPGMNGIQATKIIKDEHSKVKIIGLSFHNNDEVKQKMYEAGASAYLEKTNASQALCAAIRSEGMAGKLM